MDYQDVLNLLAAIVEQARKDQWSLTRQPYTNKNCMVGLSHAPRHCAKDFLVKLNAKVRADMTIEELAETVLEIIK